MKLLLNFRAAVIAKSLTCCLIVLTLGCNESFAWGKIGHATVAAMAERHLTDEAKSNIDKYMGGESIVKYASWLDAVRRTPEYKHTSKCHSASVDENGKHSIWSKKHRVYECLGQEIEKMRDYRSMTDSAVVVGIKIIVHLVGDMHCPAHTNFKDLSQGYGFKLFGKDYAFHKFWDSALLNIFRDWGIDRYSLWLDTFSPEQIAMTQSGTLIDWIEGNAHEVRKIYSWLEPGRNYDTYESMKIVMQANELSDSQLRKAGYRLAHVLNMIFDEEYAQGCRSII